MKFNRAYRRHALHHLLVKTVNQRLHWYWDRDEETAEEHRNNVFAQCKRIVNNRKSCSCSMCSWKEYQEDRTIRKQLDRMDFELFEELGLKGDGGEILPSLFTLSVCRTD